MIIPLIKNALTCISFLIASLTLSGQDLGSLRWNDDNKRLANDTNDWKWHRALKQIETGRNCLMPVLSFGGEDREQFRYYSHLNFGDVPAGANDEEIYLQHRFLIHSDIRFGSGVRLFLQFNSCHANGRNKMLHQVDRDDLDLMQAFIDLNSGKQFKIQVRIGRQEFSYGMERILALRDGPTIRQNFDAIRLRFATSKFTSDIITAKPVLYKTGIFDNGWRKKEFFFGSYTTVPVKSSVIDIYYFLASFDNAVFAADTGYGERHYLGLRIGKTIDPWNYDLEFTYQSGTHSSNKVRAWQLSAQAGYRWVETPLKPRFLLKGSVFTGDRKRGDGIINTFRPVSSKPPVYDLTPVGPANIILFSPEIELIAKNLTVTFRYLKVNRYSGNDGLYPSDMRKMTRSRDVEGMQILSGYTCDIQYNPNKHVSLLLYGGWFQPGDFVKETGQGQSYQALSLRAHYKF